MLDPVGHVAELATSNVFLAKDGKVHTPAPNGTFLNGKKIEEERAKALADNEHLRAEDWEPKPFAPDWVPNNPTVVAH